MLANNRLILSSMYHPAQPIFMRALICSGRENIWHHAELSVQPYMFNVGADERCSETLQPQVSW